MAELYVVNASVAEPILRALSQSTSKAAEIVEACAINPGVLERPVGLLPLYAAENMVIAAQRYVGDETFAYGAVSAIEPTQSDNVASIPVSRRQVALDALKVLVHGMNGVLTGTRFFLKHEGGLVWIKRTPSTTQWSDQWPVVQYNLSAFLNGVRLLFGSTVKPVCAEIATDRLPATLPDDLAGIPIRVGSDFTGLGFSDELLSRPLALPSRVSGDSGSGYQWLAGVDFEQLVSCIQSMLGSEHTDRLAARAASAFGMSLRTYHRRLRQLRITHRDLVAQARLSLALDLLKDDSHSATWIAMELGYRHPGDFTRFFKSRTGVVPNRYRRLAD